MNSTTTHPPIATWAQDPTAERIREITETVLVASTDQAMQPMLRPGFGPPVAELPKGPDSPFHAIVVELENVVRGGVSRGKCR
ncbi:hypothetical protein [Actinophytocola sp.]|uniref:hypothetical protein n=1 Tax=Actinophytocola sp. TaxID=1872138 RepID=UPI002ED6A215